MEALGGGSQGFGAVAVDATDLQTIDSLDSTLTANDALGLAFNPYSFTFVAPSSLTVIAFVAPGAGLSVDPVLDNVSLTPVPEPATWAMMFLGLVGLGAMLRSAQRRPLASVAA